MAEDDEDDEDHDLERSGDAVRDRMRATEHRLRRLSIDRAVLFGHRDQPGRIAVMEERIKALEGRISSVELWRTTITAKIAFAIAISAPLAGVATSLISKWIANL